MLINFPALPDYKKENDMPIVKLPTGAEILIDDIQYIQEIKCHGSPSNPASFNIQIDGTWLYFYVGQQWGDGTLDWETMEDCRDKIIDIWHKVKKAEIIEL